MWFLCCLGSHAFETEQAKRMHRHGALQSSIRNAMHRCVIPRPDPRAALWSAAPSGKMRNEPPTISRGKFGFVPHASMGLCRHRHLARPGVTRWPDQALRRNSQAGV